MARAFEKPFEAIARNKNKSPQDASAARNHFVAASGEFVGTFLFLFIAYCGHQTAVERPGALGPQGGSDSQTIAYISLSYGFSLLVTAWTLYRVSGGLFNPAVTLGMVAAKQLPWFRGVILLPAQLLGAICAAAVVDGIIPAPIKQVETALGPKVSIAQGVFLEMFMTSVLVFTVLMLAAEKTKATFIAPIGIGLALFICELAGAYLVFRPCEA